ncbi:MAG: YciI family protein [Phycisphaerales bacterium]|jgi:uncharacterized protein YciI
MHACVKSLVLIGLGAALSGCACGPCQEPSVASPPESSAPARNESRDYAMVFIKTGPLRTPTPAQQTEAMQGHRANMRRLAQEGTLLIAGPLGEPKSDPDHRGIFVFNADTIEKGAALAATDPGAQMGVFEMDPYLLSTDAPLTELTRLEREFEQRRLDDPDVPDEWFGRMYVMASADFDDDLYEQVRSAEGILIAGTLTNPRGQERVFAWVDAPNAVLASALLPEADWTMHGWYGSPTLEELPGLQAVR